MTQILHFHNLKYRVKGKVRPRTGHPGPEGEQSYNSTLSLTSVLDGSGWSAPRPGRFTPRKETRYPLYRRMGGPKGRSGRLGSILPPTGIRYPTFQAVAGRYTDYAIPAHEKTEYHKTIKRKLSRG